MNKRCSAVLAATLAAAALTFTFTAGRSRKNVVFTKDIAPILFKNCAQCHRPGEASPMSLLSYQETRPWAKSIREKVVNRQMPPWHADPHTGEFQNERRLSRQEIETIADWVDSGAPEGDPRDLPPTPKFHEGWGIGQPDLTLQMPEEFTLDASGPDEYQYFVIDPKFTEDKFVQAVEARPGNRKIVHHIAAFWEAPRPREQTKPSPEEAKKIKAQMEQESIRYEDGFLLRVKADAPVANDGCSLPNGGGGFQRDTSKRLSPRNTLAIYAPGRDVDVWAPGAVKRIPAGSRIILQVHYSKAAGSVQKDRSSVGLIFAKSKPTTEVETEMIFNAYMQIPAGAERQRVSACWTVPEDINALSLMPHMHTRGAAMEIKVVFPDGKEKLVLNVPQYDFSWQTNFTFKESLLIPKGSKFLVTGYFDNSARNKYNPDPGKVIRWGEPTYDEMLVCFLEYTRSSSMISGLR
jgi:mono/diheme cytochrome c family protein